MRERIISVGGILILIAVVIFCLAAFGAHPGGWSSARLVALGLGFFAAGHLV